MTMIERKDLTPDLVGQVVELGVYQKETDEWISSLAGQVVNYATSPDIGILTIKDSDTASTDVRWRPKEHYILITLYTEGF